jgi:hypothetical protein
MNINIKKKNFSHPWNAYVIVVLVQINTQNYVYFEYSKNK